MRDVTSAPSWMSAGELHVEWRDGEDFFYKYYYYINGGANVVKTDCLHEKYTADANAALLRRTAGAVEQWKLYTHYKSCSFGPSFTRIHTLTHVMDQPRTKKRNRIPKFKMTHRIVVSKTSLHTRVIPHHSGAHRSDTPTLLHSFGRDPNPPRAYALHQERSKQQGKRRGSVREINFAPPS